MPIRTLEPFLFDLKQVDNCPLDTLRNATIGIEVEHYLSRLFTPRKEPNFEAIGGFPLTLKSQVEADFARFQELNVKPIFVFPGLKSSVQYKYLEQSELLPKEVTYNKIWNEKTNGEHPTDTFRDLDSPMALRPIMNQFMEFLESKDVEFLVSPYSAYPQLHYLLKENVINCIFGSTDGLLIEGLDKFILGIEFENSQFKYLERQNILKKLELTSKQFKEISMCVGNGFQPFILKGFFPYTPNITFQFYHGFVTSGNSVYNSLLRLVDDNKTMNIFMQGCASLEFTPVMKLNGRVEPIQLENEASFLSQPPSSSVPPGGDVNSIKEFGKKVPSNLHELFGHKFSDELFFFQSIGLPVFEFSETLSHTNAIERLPLDASTTPLYEKLITSNKSLELKGMILNLLTNSLNRYFQFKKFTLSTYFKGVRRFDLDQKIVPGVYTSVKPLIIRHSTAKSFDLNALLTGLDDDYLNESVRGKGEESLKICTNYELISTSLVRSLIIYGFVEKQTFKLNEWGKALTLSSSFFPSNSELLLLLLLFFKQFPDIEPRDIIEPTDIRINDESFKKSAILITKFLCLLPIEHTKPVNYNYRVSRPLLQFNSIFNKINLTFGDSISVNLIALLLFNSDDIDKYSRTNDQWRKLASEVPFRNGLTNVLTGIMGLQFFELYLNDPEKNISKSFNSLNESFVSITDTPSNVFINGLKTFKHVVKLVEYLKENGLIKSDHIVGLFKDANELVDKILVQVCN